MRRVLGSLAVLLLLAAATIASAAVPDGKFKGPVKGKGNSSRFDKNGFADPDGSTLCKTKRSFAADRKS